MNTTDTNLDGAGAVASTVPDTSVWHLRFTDLADSIGWTTAEEHIGPDLSMEDRLRHGYAIAEAAIAEAEDALELLREMDRDLSCAGLYTDVDGEGPAYRADQLFEPFESFPPAEPLTLDELAELIREIDRADTDPHGRPYHPLWAGAPLRDGTLDWSSLPTYGGPDPREAGDAPDEIVSWDADRVLYSDGEIECRPPTAEQRAGLVVVADGQTQWVASRDALVAYLEAHWTRGDRQPALDEWVEPARAEPHDAYADLCCAVGAVEGIADIDDLPEFSWRPDRQVWELHD